VGTAHLFAFGWMQKTVGGAHPTRGAAEPALGIVMSMDARIGLSRRWRLWALAAVIVLSAVSPSFAQQNPEIPAGPALGPLAPVVAPQTIPANSPLNLTGKLPDISSRENFSAAMQIIILLTVLSLAPAILIMMTSFTRMIIVLSLLRQALGTQSLPPNQIIIGLAMFMTFLVMGPTWKAVNEEALKPYLDGQMDQKTALNRAVIPLRQFMIKQIVVSGNDKDVDLFADFAGEKRADKWEDVGTMTLIPAFVLSELKTAFILGFKVYLPFLIIDMVISTVLISMGMMMLPPVMISLPFKLLLFVLVDGWHLITQSLMGSFAS
jgi:flagellar biosynthetic protein FliP